MRVLIFIILVVVALFGFSQAKTKLTGINLSAAGFASDQIPGIVGHDYAFPTESDIDYFFNRSMNVVRFPILWERIQPTKNGPLSSPYSSSFAKVVQYVTGKGKYLIVDVHNYQKYYGQVIEESNGNVTTSHLLDLYSKLYTLLSPYKDKVIWGIMNEPLGDNYIKWANVCQLFINHMRSIGSVELLLIPGLSYTGAASWGKTGNYRYMWNLTDPLNNFAMEIHMYHDAYQSGTSDQCVSATIGSQQLNFVTEWMRNYKRKAFLGETGAGRNSLCYSAIDDTLSYLSDNSDVWLGWTWWAGGPRWGSYYYSLTPFSNNEDPPQWPYIIPHINNKVPTKSEITVNNYPRAGNVRVPIYNGDLNMMTSGSWASNITRQDPTKSFSSLFSYSFIPGGPSSGAIAWYGSGCMDTSFYTGMEFYINTEGNLANLNIQVIDIIDTKRERVGSTYTVADLAQGTADSKGWTKVFLNFSSYDGSAHDGFMIWSSPIRPMVYLDQVSLIHRLDKDLTSPSIKTSTTTTTTAKASTTTTATSSKGSTTTTSSKASSTTSTSSKGSTTTAATSSKGSTTTTSTSSKGSTTTTATSSKGSTTTSATSSLQTTTTTKSTTTTKPNNSNNNNDGDNLVGLGSRSILSYGVVVIFIILVFIF